MFWCKENIINKALSLLGWLSVFYYAINPTHVKN